MVYVILSIQSRFIPVSFQRTMSKLTKIKDITPAYKNTASFHLLGLHFPILSDSMRIPYEIKKCEETFKGYGIFTTKKITKGHLIYYECDVYEEKIEKSEINDFFRTKIGDDKEKIQEILDHSYATYGKEEEDALYWCRDTVGLFNHSRKNANCGFSKGKLGEDITEWRAIRDIEAGEELLFDYNLGFEVEPQWFKELYNEYCDMEYPDHSKWE